MRAFELTAGSSAKFWRIGRDGAAVTVCFGRSGTNGQTQVKQLATEAAAIGHVDRLVAEKIKKGYVEGGAAPTTGHQTPAAEGPGAGEAAPRAADEDEFVVPREWLQDHHARRGGPGVGSPAVSPEVVATHLANYGDWLLGCLNAAETPPDIRAAGTAWLAQPSTGTPVGAAAVAVLLTHRWYWSHRHTAVWAADLLLSAGGVVRATKALAVALSLEVAPESSGEQKAIRWTPAAPRRDDWEQADAEALARQLRAALAAASDEDYAAAVEALAAHRPAGQRQRVLASFLAPTRRDWVDADCAELAAHPDPDSNLAGLLLCSVTTPEQTAQVFPHIRPWDLTSEPALLHTFVEGVGTAAAPWLDRLLGFDFPVEDRRRLLGLLGAIPTDEAFRLMLGWASDKADKHARPALVEAAARFPRRALRLLAEAGGRRVAGDLLRPHVLAHAALAAELLPGLPSGAAARVQALLRSQVEAAEADLPRLLVSPPWTTTRAARKPVVDGLVCDDPPRMAWAPGERAEWDRMHSYEANHPFRNPDWPDLAARVAAGDRRAEITFFLTGPDEHTRPLLAAWRPGDFRDDSWGKRMVARFELDALPAMLDAARQDEARQYGRSITRELLPYTALDVANLMARWFAQPKSGRSEAVRAVAQEWLTRHPHAAARALIPAALGRVAAARRHAELALRAIAGIGHADTVLLVAQGYGAAALEGVERLLSTDPAEFVPDRMPKVPDWASAALLPRIQLRGGRGAVPVAAAQHVITMLSISRRDEPYPGVAVVREACEAHTLGAFAWGLFEAWRSAGAPSKAGWVFDALGHLGDDEVVRRLAPMIRAWPGEGSHTRAVTGLDILARIGSDVALMHLNGIAQKVKFAGLQERANEKVAEVADALGLTPEQLADRLVPDLGLDPGGSLTLDFGPRRFTVGFDQQLRPLVTDETGRRRKDLPKPAATDDPELAQQAQRRFAALKKDVRTVAADQIRRLEEAMVTGRRWTGSDFAQYFVAHPLLGHVARRLVWGRYDDTGTPVGALRIAEDRTFAGVNDEPVELDDATTIGVAHPLHLADTLPTWSELFADYEILQPFPQLGRETFPLGAEDARADELTRYLNVKLPTTKVLGLERRGWRRTSPENAGVQFSMARDLPGGGSVELGLDPGIVIGAIDKDEEQRLTGVSVHSHRCTHELHLRDLDPVTVSELIRDLAQVTA